MSMVRRVALKAPRVAVKRSGPSFAGHRSCARLQVILKCNASEVAVTHLAVDCLVLCQRLTIRFDKLFNVITR